MIEQSDLEELKAIYFKSYKKSLNNEEALCLANRLICLFKIVAKPIESIDSSKRKIKNGARNG